MYVLVRIGFEYNDEIYYNQGGSDGEPVKVFRDKELADLYCRQKNLEQMKNEDLGRYCYGLDEIDAGGMVNFLDNLGVNTSSSWELNLSNLTDEQWNKLYETTSLRFFDVVEVDDVLPPDLVKQAVEDERAAEGENP